MLSGSLCCKVDRGQPTVSVESAEPAVRIDSGSTSDGTVSANVTLQTLVDAIKTASNGVTYSFININPVNNQDGGQPGGNIRQAYL